MQSGNTKMSSRTTRSQVKGGGGITNTEKTINKINKARISNKQVDLAKEDKEWNNINNVETTLKDLEKQYKRANNQLTKSRIRKVIDNYDKQVKSLNSERVKERKSTEMKNNKEI